MVINKKILLYSLLAGLAFLMAQSWPKGDDQRRFSVRHQPNMQFGYREDRSTSSSPTFGNGEDREVFYPEDDPNDTDSSPTKFRRHCHRPGTLCRGHARALGAAVLLAVTYGTYRLIKYIHNKRKQKLAQKPKEK